MELAVIGMVKGIAELLTKIAGLIDPDVRSKVRKIKAMDFAEKFILTYDKLRQITNLTPNDGKPQEMNELIKKMNYYRKWFFDYN